ncbi:tho complex subunit 7 domain-containing protein [Rutstroemia sp. NJR-2017a WRK4]|nr:tho complex subunit 7 domain-containing protein [Rutstroemia sp. NJR-2017a WRK4]
MSQHHQHLHRQQASSAPPSYPFPSHSSPYLHSPTSVPISPPHTRSASAETSSAALVEDFRAYTQKLRDQYEGERAHIVADRARGMEVMAEERALWDKERGMLLARIRELEARLQGVGEVVSPLGIFNLDMGNVVLNGNLAGHAAGVPNAGMFASPQNLAPNLSVPSQPVPAQQQRARSPHRAPPSSETRKTTPPSETPHPHPDVKQESGRNADGSPFYAPAPQNPTRTFSTEAETEALRVEDIVAPRETPLVVTSKELSASDFCGSNQVSPEADRASSTIRWAEGDEEEKESDIIGADSIDISHIAPHLEGVPIKASALDPVFVARVLSPQCSSPAKLSPNIRPPGRDVVAKKTQATLLGEAEIRRLTMYAGHTPNHSISRFADLVKDAGVDSERGDETPRGPETMPNSHRPSLAIPSNGILEEEEDDTVADQDEDPALKGPLGLTNKSSKDNLFLEVLTEKLQEVEKEISEKGSPNLEMDLDTDSMASWSPMLEMKSASKDQGGKKGEGEGEGDADGMPPLKLKPSMNFGRPMGMGF